MLCPWVPLTKAVGALAAEALSESSVWTEKIQSIFSWCERSREPSSPACFSANLSLADARCLLSSSLTSRGLQSVLPVLLNKVQRHTPRVQGSLMATGILFFTVATKPRSQPTQPGNQRALVRAPAEVTATPVLRFSQQFGSREDTYEATEVVPRRALPSAWRAYADRQSRSTSMAPCSEDHGVPETTRPGTWFGHTDTAKVNFDVFAIFDPGTAISWILVTTDRILLLTTKVALGIVLSECRNHVQTFACPTSAEGAHCVGLGGKIVASFWHDKVGRYFVPKLWKNLGDVDVGSPVFCCLLQRTQFFDATQKERKHTQQHFTPS